MEAMKKLPSNKGRIRQGFRQSVLAIILVVICGLAVSANAFLASETETHLSDSSVGGAATAQSEAVGHPETQSSEEQVDVEVITVRENGFEPLEITRPHGPFILAISNRSGATELALRLDRVQGNQVHEVRLARGRTRWNQVLNLPPGDYVLSEQNHPAWICRIKLTDR